MQNARNSLCRKQRTISIRKQRTFLLNAKNIFYECSKQIRIYSKHDVQRANFINVETDFINAKKTNSIIVKFKHEKVFRFGF